MAPGESAGYGRRFVAPAPTLLATLPIGYADGVRRGLTNNADVLIGGRRRPLVGTVSMDNVTVDLGPDAVERVGDAGGADRRAGRRADPRRGDGAAARHDQLRGDVRDHPARDARVPPRRGAGVSEEALAVARSVLGDAPAWLVGGALRDRLLGRPLDDLDIVLDGRRAARRRSALARAAGGPAFELSDDFGAWRVIGPGRAWQADLATLRGGIARRRPGAARLHDQRDGRAAGGRRRRRPVRRRAPTSRRGRCARWASGRFADDPLRVMRLARLACELALRLDPATRRGRAAPRPARSTPSSPERVFAELKRVVIADRALDGLALLDDDRGARRSSSPSWRRCAGSSRPSTTTATRYGHTLEVLEHAIALEADPAGVLGDDALGARVAALLAEPLGDELPRAGGLRFAALLHDVGKPATQMPEPEGRLRLPRPRLASATTWRAAS